MLYEIADLSVPQRNNWVDLKSLARHVGKPARHVGLEVMTDDGRLLLPHLVLDLDDIDEKKLRTVLRRLEKMQLPYAVYRSGPHGYHVWIPNAWHFSPDPDEYRLMRVYFARLFPEADVNRFSPRALIRLPGSINEKYGDHVVTLVEASPGVDTGGVLPSFADYPSLDKPVLEVQEQREEDLVVVRSYWPRCIRALWERGPIEGERHTTLLRIIPWLKRQFIRQGFSDSEGLEATHALVARWLAPNPWSESERRRLVNYVWGKEYEYGCRDPVLASFCDRSCPFFAQATDPYTELVELVTTGYEQSLDLGPVLGLTHEFRLYPGEVAAINGVEGSYKSAFVQWLLIELRVPTIYFSLDMTRPLTVRRFLQIVHGVDKNTIRAYIKEKRQGLFRGMEFIHVSEGPISTLTLDKQVETESRAAGIEPRVVVIDHIGLVDSPGDSFRVMTRRSQACVDLARRRKLIVIAIDHITRTDQRTPTMAGLGRNAMTEAEGSVVLVVSKRGDNLVHVKAKKARDNKPFECLLNVSPATFRFSPRGFVDQKQGGEA